MLKKILLVPGIIFLINSFSFNLVIADDKVTNLISSISNLDEEIQIKTDDIASKREAANKYLVDLEITKINEQLTKESANFSENELKISQNNLFTNQKKFNKLIKINYLNRSNTIMNLITPELNPANLLTKITYLSIFSNNQARQIEQLKINRNEIANKISAIKAIKNQILIAHKATAIRKENTVNFVADIITTTSVQAKKVAALKQDRDILATELQFKKIAKQSRKDLPKSIRMLTRPKKIDRLTRDRAARKVSIIGRKIAVDTAKKIVDGIVSNAKESTSIISSISSNNSSGDSSSSSSSSSNSSGSGSKSGTSFNSFRSINDFLNKFTNKQFPFLWGPIGVEKVIVRGYSALGTPYAWGGGNIYGPTQGIRDGGIADSYGDYNKIGFDCSGLMIYAFAAVGLSLPHYSGYQYTMGKHIPLALMRRGDMIFYGPNASQHVTLYLGGGKMLEARESGDVVRISPLRLGGAMPEVVRLL